MSISIYTDGACSNNGKGQLAVASYGIYFGEEDPRNICGRLDASSPQTNQRAELTAILRALELCEHEPLPLTIYSDSEYSIKSVTVWLERWKRTGFKTANKSPVKNLDLIQKIDEYVTARKDKRPVTFVHVKGHSTIFGNNEADKLAQKALKTL